MQAHRNNVGCLRLLFASLVIVSHAPLMVDGNDSREPLLTLTRTVTLGDFSVDAFFLLSGYLITKSMMRAPSLLYYLERRVLRIYPAFIVAYLLAVFGLGTFLGAQPWRLLPKTLLHLAFLNDPIRYPVGTTGLLTPVLDSSMWTIIYEFRCYLLIALLGVLGLLGHRRIVLILAVLTVAASIWSTFPGPQAYLSALFSRKLLWATFGHPDQTLRLTSIFLCGSLFYLYESTIFARLTWPVAMICAVAGAVALYHDPHFASADVAILGAAVLFWVAFKADIGLLQRVNDKWDISYGVYLYGWPLAVLILALVPSISAVPLGLCTLLLALSLGAASWWGVEKWTKDLVLIAPRRTRPERPIDEAAPTAAEIGL